MKALKIFLFIITPISGFTQINKGMLLLEGVGSYSRSESETDFDNNGSVATEDDTYVSATFRVGAGVLVSESTMIGGGLHYSHSASESTAFLLGTGSVETYESNINIYYLNLNMRKFIPLSEKLYFTVTGNFNWGTGKAEYGLKSEELTEADIASYQLTIVPGASYFVNNRLAVNASFGSLYYYSEKFDPDSGPQLETTDKNYGLSLQFTTFSAGLQYFINKKE